MLYMRLALDKFSERCTIIANYMKRTLAVLLSVLALPCLCAQETAEVAQPTEENTAPHTAMDELFETLVHEAQQINARLAEITDKESADASVQELEKRFTTMIDKLRELEKLPFNHEQYSEALTLHMTTLTHVAQGCLSAMHRLIEVNAYGSETLMAVFMRYKLDDGNLPHLRAEELPHNQLYNELADILEEALFCLRGVQNEESAAAAVRTLPPLLRKLESTHEMLVQLAPLRTDEQREAVRPARERLQQLSAEIKQHNDRLKTVSCYLCPDLETILLRLMQIASAS